MATPNRDESASHADAIISLGRGTTVLIVSTILLLLFSLIGRVAVARSLSPQAFGDFNLGISVIGLLSFVSLLGLHQAMARTIAREADPGMRRKMVRLAVGVTSVMAVVASSAVFLISPELAAIFSANSPGNFTDMELVLRLFSFTLGMMLGTTLLASIFQGFENAGPNAWFNQIAQPLAFMVFVLAFLTLHLTLYTAVLAWLLSNVSMFAAILVYTVIKLPPLLVPAPIPDRPIPGLFSLSVALWGVTTLQFITAYADTLVLGAFRPASEVGAYSAAMQLGRLILAGSSALTFIFLPVAARLQRQGDFVALRRVYVTTTRWVLAITVPLLLLFLFLPSASLSAVFGPNYGSASPALAIVGGTAFLSVLVGPANSCLAGLGMTRVLFLTTLVSAIANIALSFSLIPTVGLLGAAIAWGVARAIYPASGLSQLYAAHRVNPFRRNLLLPTGITIALLGALFLLLGRISLPVLSVYPLYFVGLVVFIAVAVLTKSVEEGDLIAFHHLERVIGRPLPMLRRILESGLLFAPAGSELRPEG